MEIFEEGWDASEGEGVDYIEYHCRKCGLITTESTCVCCGHTEISYSK